VGEPTGIEATRAPALPSAAAGPDVQAHRYFRRIVRSRVGMRWWLGAIFVLIAVLTAVLVATVAARQADDALRSNSEDIAIGRAVSAAFAVEQAAADGSLAAELPELANRRGLALFVFGPDGRLLSPPRSHGVEWESIPDGEAALESALADHRFVETSESSGATLVGLPLRRLSDESALVAFAAQPAAYERSLAIFRREVLRAALWAALVAAAAGLLAAALIARRLRKISGAAAAIERGDFDLELRPRFPDEVGSLAHSIDRMRVRLAASIEQLRGERDRLRRLLGQLREAVIAFDDELGIQFANANAGTILGPAFEPGGTLPAQWAGIPLRELGHGLFRADATVAQARAELGGRSLSIIGVPAGASELAVLVVTDVTEQARRERAEREFVSNASHELRTPVSAITSAVEALESGAKDVPADRDAFIELIGRQAARLGRLTRSLLIMARAQTQAEPIQLEPVELRPLLEEIVASAGDHPHVTLRLDCPPGVTALAQRDIAEQVVSNLLGNALKHTEAGTIALSVRADRETVAIEVRDTGPGIPAEARERIFDRFYSGEQGRRDGFGLGLAIARDAARALGGSIELDSEPGRGTSARVILARAQAA
jgi:two-component system phosphate regulon sensor histidine kinase PhoR